MTPGLDAWRRQTGAYVHRGYEIRYRAAGTGPTLLAIHGFPSAAWDWHAIWPELTARFRVVAPDLIGFGWSQKPRDYAYSILDQADLLQGLLGALEIDQVHLLAHDYGDTVAQELVARHLDRRRRGEGASVLSVCLLNGGLFPETHRPRPVQRLLASPLGALVARASSRRAFEAGLRAVFAPSTPPSAEVLDELWTLLRHEQGQRVLHRLIGYMAERRRHRARWVGALVECDVPLRLIVGLVDPVSGAHMAERYRELVPHPDVVELPGIGHYPQLEAPEQVAQGILAFHDRLRAAAAIDG